MLRHARPTAAGPPPVPELDAGELTHLERVPVDAGLALEQWRAYVDVFRGNGWTVTEVEPDDAHPDGVFVEDTVVVFDDLAVLTSPGARSRVGEVASTAGALDALAAERGLTTARTSRPVTWRAATSWRWGGRRTSG